MLPMLPITILKFIGKEITDNKQHIYIYTNKKLKHLSATSQRQRCLRMVKMQTYGTSVKNDDITQIIITAVFISVYATFYMCHLTL